MTHLFQPHQADEMLNPTNEGGITLLRHALTNESGSGSLSQEQGVQCAAEGFPKQVYLCMVLVSSLCKQSRGPRTL